MMRSAQGLSVERSCLIVLAWRCLWPDSMSLRRPRVKASGWGVVVPLGVVGWDRGVSMDGEGGRGVWRLTAETPSTTVSWRKASKLVRLINRCE